MIERRSLRGAINAMCRACIYDKRAPGTAAVQIALCAAKSCPLHAVRPLTATVIPLQVLEEMRIDPATLHKDLQQLVSWGQEQGETGVCGEVAGGLRATAISHEIFPR